MKSDPANFGIETRYKSHAGQDVIVDPAVVVKVLTAIAPPDLHLARRARETFIIRCDMPSTIAPSEPTHGAWHLEGDAGVVARGSNAPDAIDLPGVPIGAYNLHYNVQGAGGDSARTANLVAAPAAAFQGSEAGQRRNWLLAVQLYGIRSRRNWGHGDFSDLSILLDHAARWGAAGIGVNPLHALFIDRAHEASPYFPNSRLFLNPLYIDIDRLPEFPGLRALNLEDEVERLRACDHVEYPAVARAKMAALRAAYAEFCVRAEPARLRDFASFREEQGPALSRFAAFETLRRRHNAPWWEWPSQWRSPNARALDRLAESEVNEMRFHEYLQWSADRQLAACRDRAKALRLPVGLYLDLAVGVAPDGADAWCEQDAMLNGLSIGAPPDALNSEGQNWGLTAYSPAALNADRFQPYRRLLSAVMRHAGAVRIDHVFGLNRLFVIPFGHYAREGTFLKNPFESLLAVTAEQSERHRCVVVGEDLGVAPENFRPALDRWGIYSYRVMQFERESNGGFIPAERYAERALVTFATHDMATFAGWRSGRDLEVMKSIGLAPAETVAERERSQAALRHAIRDHELENNGTANFIPVVRFLASTPSQLVSVSLEDALGVLDQPNVPGTVDQYPNWRKRLPILVEDLAGHEQIGRITAVMREAGRA